MQKTYKRVISGLIGIGACVVLMVACAPAASNGSEPKGYTGWTYIAYNLYKHEDKASGVVCYWQWLKDSLSCVRVSE